MALAVSRIHELLRKCKRKRPFKCHKMQANKYFYFDMINNKKASRFRNKKGEDVFNAFVYFATVWGR